MNKIKITTICTLLLSVATSFSQNPYLDFKYAIKLSNSSFGTYTDYYSMKNARTFENEVQIFKPAFAVLFKTPKGNFKEVELSSFTFNTKDNQTLLYSDSTLKNSTTISGFDTKNLNIGVRYEYIKLYRKNVSKRLVPSIGIGLLPYITYSAIKPKVSPSFSTTETSFGVNIFFTPRIYYYFKNKFFFDLNIPLSIFSFLSNNHKTYYPSKYPTNNNGIEGNLNLFSFKPTLRIGVGMKL